jgi:hypothetical protein
MRGIPLPTSRLAFRPYDTQKEYRQFWDSEEKQPVKDVPDDVETTRPHIQAENVDESGADNAEPTQSYVERGERVVLDTCRDDQGERDARDVVGADVEKDLRYDLCGIDLSHFEG